MAKSGALSIERIQRHFGKVLAVDEVDLEIAAGEFVTLLGPSGCGKTTLLRMVAGFMPPSSGKIRLNGADITNSPPEARHVNMVFQRYALFPHLDVAGNVGFGLDNAGVRGAEKKRRVGEALEMVDLASFGKRRIDALSGGQQQRIALARALVNEPSMLLLDEPLSALDRQLRLRMQIELRALQQRLGISFLFVTHDQEEALTMSDRIVVMNGGRIEQVGTPEDIYMRPQTRFVASFVGENNLIPAARDAGGRIVLTEEDRANGWLVIPPEGWNLDHQAAEGLPLSGIVTDRLFLGNTIRTLLERPDGSVLKIDTKKGLPTAGSPLEVRVNPGETWFVSKDAA
ncbi:ABC transporter ATP-binding protein [Mameliella alba]|uniref:ABC transporter ATP-binding protein n=1 Tax=Mameliella alba TaxID=561184 RepID=UPI0021BD34AA|nr:ABC transporter ATP-binding protein [Mameliella alba]